VGGTVDISHEHERERRPSVSSVQLCRYNVTNHSCQVYNCTGTYLSNKIFDIYFYPFKCNTPYQSKYLNCFINCTDISAVCYVLCLTFIKHVSRISSHYFFYCKNETHKGKGFYFSVNLMKGVRYWIKQRVYVWREQSTVQPHCFQLASVHIVQFQSPLQTVNYVRDHPFTRFSFRILYCDVLWSYGTLFSPWCLVLKFY
jgi:hypothetical protein